MKETAVYCMRESVWGRLGSALFVYFNKGIIMMNISWLIFPSVGMYMSETIICHLAKAIGLDAHAVRERNLYVEGDYTHFRMKLEQYYVPRLWKEIRESSSYDSRVAAVDAFNAANRWVKRGICMIPTKFGISFTAKFMNQVHSYPCCDNTMYYWSANLSMYCVCWFLREVHLFMSTLMAQCWSLMEARN